MIVLMLFMRGWLKFCCMLAACWEGWRWTRARREASMTPPLGGKNVVFLFIPTFVATPKATWCGFWIDECMGKILRLLAVFYYMVSSCSVFTPSLQKSEHGHALTGPPVVFAETDWELIDWRHVKCWVRPGQDAACIGNCWNPRVVADASMCCIKCI